MTAKLPPLHEALEKLANTKPTIFDVHYVDEVRRIAKWALDALNAAETAIREKE